MTQSIEMAVVGLGAWGSNLARNVEACSNTRLVAIAEADDARRAAAASRYPLAEVVATLDEILDRSNVEAVVLATPARTHYELALRVLDAGRHVLVEKPLALTVGEAESIAAAGEHADLVVMVGHTFLYSPAVHLLKEYVTASELGRVQYLYSQRLNLGRIRSDVNALWNFAPHDLSIMMHLLDERPVEVSGRGFSFLQTDIDDVCFASLVFESGVGANLHVSWIDPRKTRLMTVVGDKRMAVYDDVSVDQKIALFDACADSPGQESFGEFASLGDFQWRTRSGDIVLPRIEMREPLLNEIEAFGDACLHRRPIPSSARHGCDVVRVLVAIEESMSQGGTPVGIDW